MSELINYLEIEEDFIDLLYRVVNDTSK